MRPFALLLPLLASCAGPIMAGREDETDPPGTDEAKVVVFSDSARNATKPYAFFDDEEMLGFVQSGAWFEARVKPGEHFFFLYGASSAGVRATLKAGKTYYLRADSVPKFLRLELRLTPIVPGMEEFDRLDEILADLERREPIDAVLAEFMERHADDLERELSFLKTDGYDQCVILSPEAGR